MLEYLRAHGMRRPVTKASLGLFGVKQVSLKEYRAGNLLAGDVDARRAEFEAQNLSPRKRVPDRACKVAGPRPDVEHPLRRPLVAKAAQHELTAVLLGRIAGRSLGVRAPVSVPVVEAGARYGLPFLLGSSSVGSPNGLKNRSG
jgi:hypothetical protein